MDKEVARDLRHIERCIKKIMEYMNIQEQIQKLRKEIEYIKQRQQKLKIPEIHALKLRLKEDKLAEMYTELHKTKKYILANIESF